MPKVSLLPNLGAGWQAREFLRRNLISHVKFRMSSDMWKSIVFKRVKTENNSYRGNFGQNM